MIGRKTEIEALRRARASDESEFVAVYGRRRIGKTYLINEFFNSEFAFHIAGIENSRRREQLDLFRLTLKSKGYGCARLNSWLEAFFELENYLSSDFPRCIPRSSPDWEPPAEVFPGKRSVGDCRMRFPAAPSARR